MKNCIRFAVFIIAAIIVWRFAAPAEKYLGQLPGEIKNFANSSLPSLDTIKQNIFAPPPLTGGSQTPNKSFLTVSGTIKETNKNRAENGGLVALKENETLNIAAQNKLKDMFAQQYFEHENPQGKGPADVAKAAGYEYISIGENLALGNFKDDADLVTAWMNSPGHRANILNKTFQEIGVAVGQGRHKGNKTWIAVQEFGKPKSSCPSVDPNLKAQINQEQTEINEIQPTLEAQKKDIDSTHPQTPEETATYNRKVNQYNDLVHSFNNKVDIFKADAIRYNQQVANFNACLGG